MLIAIDFPLTCQHCCFGLFCAGAKELHISMDHQELKKKQILHRPQEDFLGLYILQAGALKLYHITEDGREIIRRIYLQNEIYGLESLAAGKHVFYAQALMQTKLCKISYPAFLDLLKKKNHLTEKILHLMSQQLSQESYLTLPNAQEKMMAFLQSLKSRLPHLPAEAFFKLPLTYAEIGEYLGLATETVCRVLLALQENGLIQMKNKHILLINTQRA